MVKLTVKYVQFYLGKFGEEKYFAEHFCQLTDEVIVPLFKNLGNIEKFPQCLVNDIKQQVSKMSTFSGQRLRKSGA